jgi:hypothetical protein
MRNVPIWHARTKPYFIYKYILCKYKTYTVHIAWYGSYIKELQWAGHKAWMEEKK